MSEEIKEFDLEEVEETKPFSEETEKPSSKKAAKKKKEEESEGYKEFKRAMAALNKKMTKGQNDEVAIAPLGEMGAVDVETISSGSAVLDNIAGGGFPVGRIIEIFGPEASGKTSIALNAVADVQRKGGNALFIDAEQALDPNYASILGVDVGRLGLTQVLVAEQVMAALQEMIKSGTADLIVVDSVASLVPQAEFDEPEKVTMALLARILSKWLPILAKLANDNKCTVIFLNQVRDAVGVMYGNPVTTPGGKALKFFASQRISVNRVGQYKEGSQVLGTEVRFRMVKNKIAPPFETGSTILTFAEGINRAAEAIEVGAIIGAIEVEGRTQYLPVEDPSKYEDEFEIVDGRVKLGTSKAACIETLKENEELLNEAVKRVSATMEAKRKGKEQLEIMITNRKIGSED